MNNQEVCHKWAHGQRGKGSNLSTDGIVLTSYSTMIAARIDDVIYISSNNMSPSTSKHLSYAARAVNHERDKIFRTCAFKRFSNDPRLTHEAMILPAAREAIEELERALAAPRTRKQTKVDAIISYNNRWEQLQEIAARTGVTLPDMAKVEATPETVEAYRIEKARQEEERRVIAAAAAKKQQEEDAEQFLVWLTTGAGSFPSSYQRSRWMRSEVITETDYLTINGGEVITSQGARVPLEHVKKALAFYDLKRWPYATNGHTIHLGDYKLDSIDEQGNIKAGCHCISVAEIQRFRNTWEGVLCS